MKLFVTGGAGFIGSNFVRWMMRRNPGLQIVNFDKLTYAGNLENLRELEGNPAYRFVRGDVANAAEVEEAMRGSDAVVHFAAETHVDRSIRDAFEFLRTNLQGTFVMLEAARKLGIERYIQISTDEVYGSLPEGAADEQGQLQPNSPYAASKAGADHLVRSYHVTYGLPCLVVRASNNYGPYQFPEKFLPLLITNAMDNQSLPIYGDGNYVREWLFVEDFCAAIELVLNKGAVGQIYNVGSEVHKINLEVVQAVLKRMGKPETLVRHVQDRPGHDRRYAIISDKVRALGWKPSCTFEEGLDRTIAWYQANEAWWRPLKQKVMCAEPPISNRLADSILERDKK